MSRLTLALAALLAAVPAYASTPVNINTADATALAHSLDGVGLSKAKAIVAWREANGDFESADQLADVKGIGPSLVERNRDAILLGDDKPAKKKATTKARHAEAE